VMPGLRTEVRTSIAGSGEQNVAVDQSVVNQAWFLGHRRTAPRSPLEG
jgi:hypothetical protein